MPKQKSQNTWVLIVGGIFTLVLVGVTLALDALQTPLDGVIRAGALLGYLCVFLASLSSLYMRELTRYFSRPFIKLHHIVAVAGLVALSVHALSLAWRASNLAIFLPVFSSVRMFFALGGRPAFWLIAVAALTALLRKSIGKRWKIIHWLNYLAFILGTIHAQMIGANFQHLGVRLVSGAMLLALVGIFAQKRLRERRRTAKK